MTQAVRWMFLLESGWPVFKIVSLAAWSNLSTVQGPLALPSYRFYPIDNLESTTVYIV